MIEVVIAVISLAVLVKSAEVFVNQACALAKKKKVSDFLIGFTIVALGTSLPELVSAIFSALAGHSRLLAANIIGSNIVNLCLVLGTAAVYKSYKIYKRDVDLNIPLNLAALATFWALASWFNFKIGFSVGISLILIFVALILLSKEYNHVRYVKREYPAFETKWLILALIFLVGSGKICVDSVINTAAQLKISETILGYFFLAIGTSLPELVTAILAVKRHEEEMGIGSILGSNLFNLLFVIGISALIGPVDLTKIKLDLIFLTGVTLITYMLAVYGKKYYFSRKEGVMLLLIYGGFVLIQILK